MFDSLVYAADLADLSEVWTSVVQKWVGPALIMVLGAMSLTFLFGENGSMIKNAKNIATSVN